MQPQSIYWTAIIGDNWPAIGPAEWGTLETVLRQGAGDLEVDELEGARRDFEARVRASDALQPVKDEMLAQQGNSQDMRQSITFAAALLRDYSELVHRTRNRMLDIVDQATGNIAAVRKASGAQDDPVSLRVYRIVEAARDEVVGVASGALHEIDALSPGLAESSGPQTIVGLSEAHPPEGVDTAGVDPAVRSGTDGPGPYESPGQVHDNPDAITDSATVPLGIGPSVGHVAADAAQVVNTTSWSDSDSASDLPGPQGVGSDADLSPWLAGPPSTRWPRGVVPPGFGSIPANSAGQAQTDASIHGAASNVIGALTGNDAPVHGAGSAVSGVPVGNDTSPHGLGSAMSGGPVVDSASIDSTGLVESPALSEDDVPSGSGAAGVATPTAPLGAPDAAAAAGLPAWPMVFAPQESSPSPGVPPFARSGASVSGDIGNSGSDMSVETREAAAKRLREGDLGVSGEVGGMSAEGPSGIGYSAHSPGNDVGSLSAPGGSTYSGDAGRRVEPGGNAARGADTFRTAVGGAMAAATTPAFEIGGERVDGDLVLACTILGGMLSAVESSWSGVGFAVAVVRQQDGVSAIVTSNEGRGWLPAGLYLPRAARVLGQWAAVDYSRWEGISDPARVLAEFAVLQAGRSGARLSALASSQRIDPGLRMQLGEVSMQGAVAPSAAMPLAAAGPACSTGWAWWRRRDCSNGSTGCPPS